MKGITMLSLCLRLLAIGMSIFPPKHLDRGISVGQVTLNADGSITPPTAPIWTPDNVTYYVTDDIDGYIQIRRSNIVLDGNGTTLSGSDTYNSYNGIELNMPPCSLTMQT